MSWSSLALLPLLVCAAACLPLGWVQRAAVRGLAWLMRLAVLAGLSLLGVYLTAPQWLPTDVALSLDDGLGLSASDSADPWRLILGLLYAAAATGLAAPILVLLDFTRTLGQFESRCRTLSHLLRDTLHLAENARPLGNATASSATPPPVPTAKPSVNRLRPLSELLG